MQPRSAPQAMHSPGSRSAWRDATGSQREPVPMELGAKAGVSQRNHPPATTTSQPQSRMLSPRAGCSAPKWDAQPQNGMLNPKTGCSAPAFPNCQSCFGWSWCSCALCFTRGWGVGTLAEVGADVGHLVAICCRAGGGVAVAEAAGAASRVVGLQVKPAWLAPGHREETGAGGKGQAYPQGTTAAPWGGRWWQL